MKAPDLVPHEQRQADRRQNHRRAQDEWTEHLERRLRSFFAKCLFVISVMGIISAGSILGFGIVLKAQSKTSRTIQQQRYDYIYTACVDQNARHEATIDRAQEALPLESRQTATLLVDQLQPFTKDCAATARKRVKGDR